MPEHILVIDDEESLRYTFSAFLEGAGYQVQTAATFNEGVECLERQIPGMIFLDIMLGRHSGLDLLKVVHQKQVNSPVVMITGAPEIETAAEALRQGAFDYIPKPVCQQTLLKVAKVALQHKKVLDERETYRSHLEAIFRSLRDGLLLIDPDRRICQANQALFYLSGLPECIRGMSLDQFPETLRRPLEKLFVQTMKTRTESELRRTSFSHPGEGQKVVDISAAPWFGIKGEIEGVVVSLHDQTRLDTLERSIGQRQQFAHIIGQSNRMQQLFGLIENLAEVDTTVLIAGESGTGKELVAEALHFRSERSNKPMVKVNCAALPENLLESELFGHLKGSFTGAIKDKIGRFEQAEGGTIFLDEIGDISPALQVRLLRVLQSKEIEKVGSSQPVRVDVRIVAATNQNLIKKVQAGEFREDLYYRLRVVQVNLPPLRERRDDIPLLIDHFIEKFNRQFNRNIQSGSSEALALMNTYNWPGNIRELENTIEHVFVMCRSETFSAEHLPPELTDSKHVAVDCEISRQALMSTLEDVSWNKSKAAKQLGISRRTIYRKIEEYGLTDPAAE